MDSLRALTLLTPACKLLRARHTLPPNEVLHFDLVRNLKSLRSRQQISGKSLIHMLLVIPKVVLARMQHPQGTRAAPEARLPATPSARA
jgi:hypothetical protein